MDKNLMIKNGICRSQIITSLPLPGTLNVFSRLKPTLAKARRGFEPPAGFSFSENINNCDNIARSRP
ncbi:MAG: hypothetical protein GDA43_12430 [Hormoscilla sp. SP5CHS1]|nr:hypothetical protein [Hormoscilla sp. SP12CHS1]MBC6453903.1 hypothetical protein [Hormoscilla sp. SP5CHS1]